MRTGQRDAVLDWGRIEDAATGGRWQEVGRALEGATAQTVVAWAGRTFGARVALACSFGAEDMVLLDLCSRQQPPIGVFYLDTGLLFDETYELIREAEARYPDVPIRRVTPALTIEEQATCHGPELWRRDPDRCCHLRKVEPLREALRGLDAWITGIRRGQTPTRAGAGVVEWDVRNGLVKVNPLATWTWQDVWDYIHAHDIPYNPLHERGYPSIGCAPCTRAVRPGEDPRAGRWAGFQKTECGLHG
ncbi:MAG: phosphoadenylyl-sulfate reductase [Clostridia bacterium]|nr:phosphoadenylyl-sulfate reductase [Clostridia bacterium]